MLTGILFSMPVISNDKYEQKNFTSTEILSGDVETSISNKSETGYFKNHEIKSYKHKFLKNRVIDKNKKKHKNNIHVNINYVKNKILHSPE